MFFAVYLAFFLQQKNKNMFLETVLILITYCYLLINLVQMILKMFSFSKPHISPNQGLSSVERKDFSTMI